MSVFRALLSSRRGVTIASLCAIGLLLYLNTRNLSSSTALDPTNYTWNESDYNLGETERLNQAGEGGDVDSGGPGEDGAPRPKVPTAPTRNEAAAQGWLDWGMSNWRGKGDTERPKLPALREDDVEEDYRSHLEKTTGYVKHSKTLTFSHIYVISVPGKEERRRRMEKLARAVGLTFTFFDAINKDVPAIDWIGERVAEVRKQKVRIIAERLGIKEEEIGGGGIGSAWLEGADRPEWHFPSLKEERWGGLDWVEWMESHELDELAPSTEDFNVTEALLDPLEPDVHRQINEGVLATWWSHTHALRKMRDNGDDSALILEDDIDLEWDIERMWASAHRRLPADWDTVFLGHCWGREGEKPAYLHPQLHQSTQPKCMHGYAVSRAGMQKLLARVSDPWVAAQSPVDWEPAAMIRRNKLNSFSLEPSVIIQTKDMPSDLQVGVGSGWRGVLADSTMERIWRDEGHDIPEPVFDPKALDPAVKYRGIRRPVEEAPFVALRKANLKAEGGKGDAPKDGKVRVEDAINRAAADKATNPFMGEGGDNEAQGFHRRPAAPAAAGGGNPGNGGGGRNKGNGGGRGAKKIGTGGKMVGQQAPPRPKAAAANGDDAFAREGGRRVGTGARPGAAGNKKPLAAAIAAAAPPPPVDPAA